MDGAFIATTLYKIEQNGVYYFSRNFLCPAEIKEKSPVTKALETKQPLRVENTSAADDQDFVTLEICGKVHPLRRWSLPTM
jgi:hypothetical protein